MARFAYPLIGGLSVAGVDTSLVLEVLQQPVAIKDGTAPRWGGEAYGCHIATRTNRIHCMFSFIIIHIYPLPHNYSAFPLAERAAISSLILTASESCILYPKKKIIDAIKQTIAGEKLMIDAMPLTTCGDGSVFAI